jgi:hypothetical protein
MADRMKEITSQSICVRCGVPITEANDSREHVIPNAIGGRLKTRGFICGDCNNAAGETWDAALAEQLNPLCLFFGIVRERGTPPTRLIETTAGERLLVQPGGGFLPAKPTYQELASESGTQVQIVARTMREAKKMLKGVKRKFPSVDTEAMLKAASPSRSYPEGMVRIDSNVGGEVAGRSIVKSAVAIAHHAGVSVEACDIALGYLRESHATPCFGFYYEKDLTTGRPAGVPLHCVAVSGNPETGLLLGYVEYFGAHRIVVCLSESYGGPPIAHAYGLDPMTGQEVALAVQLPFTREDIQAIYNYEKIPPGSVAQAYSEVIPTGMRQQHQREQEQVIADAVQYAFANCGAKKGELLTNEHLAKLPGLITQRMMPFILNCMRATPPNPFLNDEASAEESTGNKLKTEE